MRQLWFAYCSSDDYAIVQREIEQRERGACVLRIDDSALLERLATSFAGKVSGAIRGGEDDAFYRKVRTLLQAEGEVSDAIGRLTDRAVYDKLSYEEKQRYTLTLSERYLKALERFRRECEYEGRKG